MKDTAMDTETLRGLVAKATPGEWRISPYWSGTGPDERTYGMVVGDDDLATGIIDENQAPCDGSLSHDLDLIVYLVNSIPAIEALIERMRVLEEALCKAERPVWFYHPDHTEVCQWSPHEVVDEYYDPAPGEYVFEVECARPLPSIWCAVRVTADEDADERFTLTEHASEDEARAALSKEPRT